MIKISFVVPTYKTEKFLKPCLDSLLMQESDEFEIIVVLDGENPECEKIVCSYDTHARKKFLRWIKIPHGGACAARNAGAGLAKGEYVSFFSSDFVMFPGGTRRWIQALEDKPDFIYSGYRWKQDNQLLDGGYPAEEFDARQLEVHNYIDGGFPVKRELWKKYPWDVNCKSLNDWLFWLKMTRNGHKGKQIQDICYAAELPRPKGLSDDSNSHWLERVDYVKKQVGIKHRDICVASLGAQYHAKKMAEILDADFNITTIIEKPTRYKLFYLMGFYTQDASMITSHMSMVRAMKARGTKVVVHWIGGDTWQLMKKPFIDVKKLVPMINKHVDVHLCENKRCAKELAEMGIDAKVVPVPVHDERELLPQPKRFRVAMYYPGHTLDPTDKNMRATLFAIADKLPKVKFNFYGMPGAVGYDNHHRNVHHCGRVDFNKFGKSNSVIVRLCRHDSVPIAAVDFILMGRRAITNIEKFKYMSYIDGKKGLIEPVCEEIMRMKNSTRSLAEQKRAREYYLNEFKQSKYIRRIRGLA